MAKGRALTPRSDLDQSAFSTAISRQIEPHWLLFQHVSQSLCLVRRLPSRHKLANHSKASVGRQVKRFGPQRVREAEGDRLSKKPQVVIVGAGFGGLGVAEHLAHVPADLTFIDRHNYHTFQPLLYVFHLIMSLLLCVLCASIIHTLEAWHSQLHFPQVHHRLKRPRRHATDCASFRDRQS